MIDATLAQRFLEAIQRGERLRTEGQLDAALASFRHAAELIPGHSAPFTRIACLRLERDLGAAPSPRPSHGPRIQMRALGDRGRFGNQLLQYGFLRLYAERHGLVAETPDWFGRHVYGFADALIASPLPTVDENDVDLMAALRGELAQIPRDCDITGYFCGDMRAWGSVAARFRALYDPLSALQPTLAAALAALRRRGQTIVAIHLRRGDFGYGRFWVAPGGWYLRWLRELWPRLADPVLYIATDDVAVGAEFAEFSPLMAHDLGVKLEALPELIDHHVLAQAEHLAISNSSFSFTAALLNTRCITPMRPHPDRHELVEFDAWTSRVLLDPTVTAPAEPSIGGAGTLQAPLPRRAEFLGTVGLASAHPRDRPVYLVASMYTQSHRPLAERLARSLRTLSLPFALYEVPHVHRSISEHGSFDAAYTKANFIRFLHAEYRVPVLYLDCDCIVRSEPRLIRSLADAGVEFAIYNWLAELYTDAFMPVELRDPTGRVIEPRDRYFRFSHSIDAFSPTQLTCSGPTQFYANSARAKGLLDAWSAVIDAHPGVPDDHCLDIAFNRGMRAPARPQALWLDKAYARYLYWIYVRPIIDHPQMPAGRRASSASTVPLPPGPRFDLSVAETRSIAPLLPRDCLIDRVNKRLLRPQASKTQPGQIEAVDLGPLPFELYLDAQ